MHKCVVGRKGVVVHNAEKMGILVLEFPMR